MDVLFVWSGRRGSNSLPPPWQGGALPDELRPRNSIYYKTQSAVCQHLISENKKIRAGEVPDSVGSCQRMLESSRLRKIKRTSEWMSFLFGAGDCSVKKTCRRHVFSVSCGGYAPAGEVPGPVGSRQRMLESSRLGKIKRTSEWMSFLFGAGDEARTRYLHLGKVALYQMSYARRTGLIITEKSCTVNIFLRKNENFKSFPRKMPNRGGGLRSKRHGRAPLLWDGVKTPPGRPRRSWDKS